MGENGLWRGYQSSRPSSVRLTSGGVGVPEHRELEHDPDPAQLSSRLMATLQRDSRHQ